MILISIILFFFLILLCLLTLYALLKKKMQYWIVSDFKKSMINLIKRQPKGTIHIMFAFVDHFEPGNRNASLEQQVARVNAWIEGYPRLASRHQDNDGIYPQHTFFFPPHYDTDNHLERIVKLCSQGFGEVEMHLHHDRQAPWPDDESSLRQKLLDCIESFSRYDIFCLPNGQKKFAFIHGDWALANSLKRGAHCGVNNEISILQETGCYADFTFPVCNETQPKLANTFFYARTEKAQPKSYNIKPVQVKKGASFNKGLMLIQGIIGLRWKSRIHRFIPSIEQSNVDVSDYPFRERIDYWVKKGLHVKGKRNWIFIKIHAHGAREEDRDILLGKSCDDMFSYLESNYNDGEKFVLHYVSAREMYNIIKAAEAGNEGDPNQYRSYIIPRYTYLKARNDQY